MAEKKFKPRSDFSKITSTEEREPLLSNPKACLNSLEEIPYMCISWAFLVEALIEERNIQP